MVPLKSISKQIIVMEVVEDVVIVGAGIAGLATALGLHRLGIQSLVLESAEILRTTGFALGIWRNAWKALDALGVGQILRAKHIQLTGIVTASVDSGLITAEVPIKVTESGADLNVRCVIRKVLLETLENELPRGTVKYSSKVVHIQDSGCFKSIHLDDGTILKAKVLIGCDGVNSVVAKYLGLTKPSLVSRSAVRAFVHYKDGHGFEPKVMQFFGNGYRFGVIPCDDFGIYWFFSFVPSPNDEEIVTDRTKLKQFILSKLGKVSDKVRDVFEKTDLNNMDFSPLRFRNPWNVLWGNISKDNVCVAGDALHPMTPDLAQGGCSALEDGIVLARVLAEALKEKSQENDERTEYERIRKGLEKFAKERRWRSIDLISTSYFVGFMQASNGIVLNFIRDKIMAKFLGGILLQKASFDCGELTVS